MLIFRIGKKKFKIKISMVLLYIVMIALVAFTALPLVYVISTAFKPMEELFLFPPKFLVRRPILTNFSDLVLSLGSSSVPFTRYVFNSLLITTIIVALTVAVSSMGAYALVKHNPPGSRAVFNLILVALMFSNHVTQIPRYLVVNFLGLIDTYWALILPNIAVAYNIFLMKQFIEQFPDTLIESARLDGASELTVFLKIVMPSLGPAWSTLIVFSFNSNWNDYFSPLIYITSQAMKTMPLALQTIAGGPATMSISRQGAVAASSFLMTVPTVVIFTTMQKKVMETMVHSGIKG